MTKSKLGEIHYKRFYEVVKAGKDKIWTIKTLLEKINRMIPSNLELTETGLRALISNQYKFYAFKYARCYNGKTTTYYIFERYLQD